MSLSCRLVHPTSRLLVQVEGHPTLPPGLLLINSTGVLLLGDPGEGRRGLLNPPSKAMVCACRRRGRCALQQEEVKWSPSEAALLMWKHRGLLVCVLQRF